MKSPKCILKQEAFSENNEKKSSINSVSFTCHSKFSSSKTSPKKLKNGKKCSLTDGFETCVVMEPQCCFKRCLQIVGENLEHDLKSYFEECYSKSTDPDFTCGTLEWSLWNIYKGIRKELDVLSNSPQRIDDSKNRSLLSNSELVSLKRSLTPELKTSWSPWAWSCNSVSSSDHETLSTTNHENDFIGFTPAECRLDFIKTRFPPTSDSLEALFESQFQSQNISLKTLKSRVYPVVLVKRLVMKTPLHHVKPNQSTSPPRAQLPLSSSPSHIHQLPLSLPKLRSSSKIHRRILN